MNLTERSGCRARPRSSPGATPLRYHHRSQAAARGRDVGIRVQDKVVVRARGCHRDSRMQALNQQEPSARVIDAIHVYLSLCTQGRW